MCVLVSLLPWLKCICLFLCVFFLNRFCFWLQTKRIYYEKCTVSIRDSMQIESISCARGRWASSHNPIVNKLWNIIPVALNPNWIFDRMEGFVDWNRSQFRKGSNQEMFILFNESPIRCQLYRYLTEPQLTFGLQVKMHASNFRVSQDKCAKSIFAT